MPVLHIHINSVVFHLGSSAGGLLPWRRNLSRISASLATYTLSLSSLHSVLTFPVCVCLCLCMCVCIFSLFPLGVISIKEKYGQ